MAVAVVRDINHDLINGGVVGDARNRAAILRDVVSIRTCGVEYQLLITADGGGSIQAGDRSGGIARHGGIALTRQGETEGIRIVPSAAIQHFFDMEQVFGYNRVRLCVVGVYKLGFFVFGIAVSNRGFQLIAFGIQRNRDGGGDIRGIGHTIGGDTRLFDGVGVSTRLFVGDCTEIGGRCGFGYRCRCAVASGHRGIVVRRKGKGKSFAILPVTAGNALSYTQRGHGCTFKCVGEGYYISGGYFFPLIAIPLIVGGRDGQGLRFRTIGRNLGFNQILFLAVINISLIIIYFGKQVIIGLTMVICQRVGNITKGNLTNRIVNGVCCVARHRDVGVAGQLCVGFVYRCSFEFEVELTVGQSHRIALLILVGFRSLNNERLGVILKGVGKCDILRICGCVITEYMLNTGGFHFQLAAAVVRDGNRHTVEGAVIRNTRNLILGGDNFSDVVHIRAGFGEGDISEVKGNRCIGGAIGVRHFALNIAVVTRQRCAIDGHQTEGKAIVCLPTAALQNLFAFERVIGVRRFYLNLSGLIGVCHRNFLGCTCRDCACAVRNAICIAGRQSFFRDGIGAARGQTHNLGSLVGFQLESIAALDGLSSLNAGNSVHGIGVQVTAPQLKLHRKFGVEVRVQTVGVFNFLGNLQAALGVHGQLTVVAKVQHTLVCAKIPLEVNAAIRSAGFILFLIAQLVINGGGQAAFFDALLDVAIAIFCNNALIDFVLSCNANGHIVGLVNRLSMRRGNKMQVVQLIVIGLVRLYYCGRSIVSIFAFTCFGVQQGILGVIVVAVACCRGKGGSGQADGFICAVCRCFAAVIFVGVEADFAVLGVLRNVGGKVGVGKVARRNLVARSIFKADRVDNTDWLGVVNYQLGGVIGVCDLIISQGQHTGRNLNLHMVAVTAAAVGDGDNDVS